MKNTCLDTQQSLTIKTHGPAKEREIYMTAQGQTWKLERVFESHCVCSLIAASLPMIFTQLMKKYKGLLFSCQFYLNGYE